MRRSILVIGACLTLYAVAMEAVNYGAKQIVSHFGLIGTLLTLAAMYGAAVLYERRQQRKKIEILPPL
jgi:hypothetical protein